MTQQLKENTFNHIKDSLIRCYIVEVHLNSGINITELIKRLEDADIPVKTNSHGNRVFLIPINTGQV